MPLTNRVLVLIVGLGLLVGACDDWPDTAGMTFVSERDELTIFVTICSPRERIVGLRLINARTNDIRWQMRAIGVGTQEHRFVVGDDQFGLATVVPWNGLTPDVERLRVEVDMEVDGKIFTQPRPSFRLQDLRHDMIRANGSTVPIDGWLAHVEKECRPSKGLLGSLR